MNYQQIDAAFTQFADPKIAENSKRFFKSGKDEYAEGDKFLGLRVPILRQHVKLARELPFDQILKFLHSQWHEKRLFAFFLLVDRFQRANDEGKKEIFDIYVSNIMWVNNWDLVDSSAHKIIGAWLSDKDRGLLYKLVESNSLWERRIAIMATFHFIRNGDLTDIFALSERLLHDNEDLIHKVVGWMLREAGKRDRVAESNFLKKHYEILPRTLLRYAIEKYSPEERKAWLSGAYQMID